MSKAKINKINITVGSNELELTLEQARDLKKILDELFPAPYIPSAPIIIERDRWIPQPQPQWPTWEPNIICKSSEWATLSLQTHGH